MWFNIFRNYLMSPPDTPKSRFLEYLLANNQPYMAGFKKWVFLPGMLFQAGEQWWGDKKKRAAPHEGIDLCCFEDSAGEVKQLNGSTRIPAAFAGKIGKIDHDFLGKSIFIGHEIFDGSYGQLYTIYGHTDPGAASKVSGSVAEGEVIGLVAEAPGRKTTILPHLHLTVAWIPPRLPLEELTWQNMGRDGRIRLLDPLLIL